MRTKDKILGILMEKHKDLSMGALLNLIQDAAEKALDGESFWRYQVKSFKDLAKTEGSDGLIFNGEYFDWKEFEPKKFDIAYAFLGYFSESDLILIKSVL